MEKDFIKYVDLGLGDVPVMVGPETRLSRLATETDGHRLRGVEMFKGHDISMAEAVTRNVSHEGTEIGALISGVVCLDTVEDKKVKFTAAECKFSPSSSIFMEEERYSISSILIRLAREIGEQ